MPTTNPRISITLSADDLGVLDRYARASKTPRATIVAGLLCSAIPELGKAAELIERANAAPRRIRQAIVDDLSNATADAMGFFAPFDNDWHLIVRNLQHELALDSPTIKREGSTAKGPRDGEGSVKPSRLSRKGSDPHLLTGGSK